MSHPPNHVHRGSWWADVYKCIPRREGLEESLYVKFIIDESEQELVLMSCKPWRDEG